VGDIVLLREERKERGHWPIGRVTKLLSRAGQNDVRTVEVMVGGKKYTRSAGGLCFLTPGN